MNTDAFLFVLTNKHIIYSKKKATFRLEGEIAELADVWSDVGVCADVLFQHAGLLAADAAFLADVLPSAPAPHVNIVFIGFVPGTQAGLNIRR